MIRGTFDGRARSLPMAVLFWTALGAGLSGWFANPASGAENEIEVRRVAVLSWRHTSASTPVRDGIREGLLMTRLPLLLEEKDCGGELEVAREIVRSWRERNFDLFVAADHEATLFLRKEVRDRPVVFATTRHPDLSGMDSHPGRETGNVTGVFLQLDLRAVMSFFRSIIPDLARIGVVHSASESGTLADVRKIEALAGLDGPNRIAALRFEKVAVKEGDGWPAVEAAVYKLAARGVRALWIPDDPNLLDWLPRIATLTNREKIALIGTHPHGVRRHMTLGVSPDYRQLGIRAAAMCAKIARKGAPPGEIPIAVVRSCNLIVNLRAARRASVRVPLEALPRADVIIDRDGW